MQTNPSELLDEEVERQAQQLAGLLDEHAETGWADFAATRIDYSGTSEFTGAVLEACRAIPAGETATYGDLARRVGRPGAARAVGRVMASNRVPIVIPCHRVVGARGGLTGYSAPGGLAMKQRLLDLERRAPKPRIGTQSSGSGSKSDSLTHPARTGSPAV